ATLPIERSYAFHRALSAGAPQLRRDPQTRPAPTEMAIPEHGWAIVIKSGASEPLRRAAEDLRLYLEISMQTNTMQEPEPSLTVWASRRKAIVAGARQDLPGCGASLSGSKDYEMKVNADQIVVCGYDELGAMHGLYNLQERMDLREGPF